MGSCFSKIKSSFVEQKQITNLKGRDFSCMNCHFFYLKDTPIIIRNQDNITSTLSIVKHKSLFRALLLRTGSAFAKQPNKEVPAPLKYFVTEILCHSGTQGRESQVQTQQQSSRLTFDQQSKQSLTQHQTGSWFAHRNLQNVTFAPSMRKLPSLCLQSDGFSFYKPEIHSING